MAKKMLIDATHPEETRVVVADGNKVEEFDFESMNRRQLAGNIYLAKVTRVEPSLQAAFVDYGGNRHGFLAFSEIHPDYYQIPKADRDALIAEEQAEAEAAAEEDEKPAAKPKRSRSRSRSRKKTEETAPANADAAAPEADATEASATAQDAPAVEDGADAAPAANAVAEAAPADETPAEAPVETAKDAAPAEDKAPDEGTPPTSIAEDAGIEDAVMSEEPEETGSDDTAPEGDVVSDDAPKGEEAAPVDAASDEAAKDAPAEAPVDAAPESMDVVDLDEGAADETPDAGLVEDKPKPRRRRASAAEKDADVETVADDDDAEEIRPVRKPRARRYKIQEVVKVRQVMLVQVVKEERGNKGAALTTYLSLAGRYCVLMPNTARGGGISRKITNAPDRKKLKEIANEIDVPKGAGLIIRTAGAKRTKTEIKRDYEYLQRQWEQIRELTLKSIAPAPIYEEGNLIRRSIRDLYNRDIDEVIVEGEAGYRHAKDFMKMIMPSHAKNVKHYTEGMPLFARHQVESYLSGMFNPTVQLKSGGYIVIGITEALVAIDVNSGKATKEGSIEDTATKTNLEAADEVARQLRLRDLAGLIVIDFIDMDERRNNSAVEKRMKEALKTDRARIQVGRISGFGLMEMSRQRLRPGMLEATTQPCPSCHGTGLIRSDDSLALSILRSLEEEGTRKRSREVLLKLPVDVANYIMNDKREHLAMIEERYGMAVRIAADPHLVAPDFEMEKFKTATRVIRKAAANVVSMDSALMDDIDADAVEDAEEVVDAAPAPEGAEEGAPKKKRRRRSRRRKGGNSADGGSDGQANDGQSSEGQSGDAATSDATVEAKTEATSDAAPKGDDAKGDDTPSKEAQSEPSKTEEPKAEKPKKAPRKRSRAKAPAPKAEPKAEDAEAPTSEAAADPAPKAETPAEAAPEPAKAEPAPAKPKSKPRVRAKAPAPTASVAAEEAPAPEVEVERIEEAPAAPAATAEATPDDGGKKRRGWWSLKR